jgi:hypothetical protein
MCNVLYAVDGQSVLILQKGDMIELTDGNLGESVLSGEWGEGLCERTQVKGCFPVESVYVLPTIKRPPSDILVSKLYYPIAVLSYYRK